MRSPQAGAFMAEMTIVPLFSALRDASVDPRPEVRNSGVRTLVNTLTSHGGSLAPRAWHCLWHVFFPLLDEIRAPAAAASDEEQDATVGSKDGERVVMLVHHSRNTASKQWDETLTLSLGGVGKLARAHFRQSSRVARRFRRTMGRLPRFFRPLRRERRQGDIPRRHLRVTDDHLVARVHAGDAPALFSRCLERTPTRRARVTGGDRARQDPRGTRGVRDAAVRRQTRGARARRTFARARRRGRAARAPEPWRNDAIPNAKPNSNLGQSYAAEETRGARASRSSRTSRRWTMPPRLDSTRARCANCLSYAAPPAAKGDSRGTTCELGRAPTEIETQPAATRVTRSARRRARRSRTCTETRGGRGATAPRRSARRRGTRGGDGDARERRGAGGVAAPTRLPGDHTRDGRRVAAWTPARKYASAVRGIEEAWGAVSDAFETLLLGSRGDGRRRGDFVKSLVGGARPRVAAGAARRRRNGNRAGDGRSRGHRPVAGGSAPDAARERLVAVLAETRRRLRRRRRRRREPASLRADAERRGRRPDDAPRLRTPPRIPPRIRIRTPRESFPRACLRRLFVLYARARVARRLRRRRRRLVDWRFPRWYRRASPPPWTPGARAASTPERYAVPDADAPALETVAFVADVVASVARVDRERGGGGGSLVGWLRKTVAGDEVDPNISSRFAPRWRRARISKTRARGRAWRRRRASSTPRSARAKTTRESSRARV